MNLENFEENSIRRYLLGELSEDEQTRVEDAAFADADLFLLVESVENDLIDEYARGELEADEKRNFERLFLTSAERQKKIEFAQTLVGLEEKSPALAKISAPAPERRNLKNFWQTLAALIFRPQIAFAAVALLILLGGWLIFVNTRKSEREIAKETNANIAPPTNQTAHNSNDPATNSSSPSPGVSPNIAHSPAPEKPNQNKPANVPPTPLKASPTPPIKNESPAPTFAALIFPLGMTRDGGGGKALQLKLAPQVTTARLVFNLEKGDEYKNYRIEIRSKSGAVNINSNGARSGRAVVINIPAARLAAGKYEAVLSGFSRDTSRDDRLLRF